MRTWIIVSTMILAEAIDPGHVYSSFMGATAASMICLGLIMDTVELVQKFIK